MLPGTAESMIIIPILTLLVCIVALIANNDRLGAIMVSFLAIVLSIWLLYMFYLHLIPIEGVYNNLCPAEVQVKGYCPGS